MGVHPQPCGVGAHQGHHQRGAGPVVGEAIVVVKRMLDESKREMGALTKVIDENIEILNAGKGGLDGNTAKLEVLANLILAKEMLASLIANA